ncbi:MAG: hypothetical protein AUH43_25970 [Acidobacteria bacterium 13_1_40CM_65_14]|nr:MAG: hypothetical protein AUH43_25970 [Acidobacteria bacterium 13_1_40CM_65_14]OLE84596.1 MAG: hypothetical protein AUF76_02985 [Acidobacteria bacterium 13_1_20CM_2_65_9]
METEGNDVKRLTMCMKEDPSGTLALLDVQTLPTCCELYITHKPLAILSRGGARCWLSSRMYEDRIEYALTASQHISFAEEPSNCGLK